MNNNIVKTAVKTLSKYSPEIAVGAGVASLIVSVCLGVRAGAKAHDILEDCKDEELTSKEIIKKVGPTFVPVVVTAAAGTVSIIAGTVKGQRRTAAMAAAYSMTQTAFTEYKESVIEEIGEKKAEKIRKRASDKHVKKIYSEPGSLDSAWDAWGPFDDNDYEHRCRCLIENTGEAFVGNEIAIEAAFNKTNHDLNAADNEICDFVSWNDLRNNIGDCCHFDALKSRPSLYEDMGWLPGDVDRDGIYHRCEYKVTDNGTRYLLVTIIDEIHPKYSYESTYCCH